MADDIFWQSLGQSMMCACMSVCAGGCRCAYACQCAHTHTPSTPTHRVTHTYSHTCKNLFTIVIIWHRLGRSCARAWAFAQLSVCVCTCFKCAHVWLYLLNAPLYTISPYDTPLPPPLFSRIYTYTTCPYGHLSFWYLSVCHLVLMVTCPFDP